MTTAELVMTPTPFTPVPSPPLIADTVLVPGRVYAIEIGFDASVTDRDTVAAAARALFPTSSIVDASMHDPEGDVSRAAVDLIVSPTRPVKLAGDGAVFWSMVLPVALDVTADLDETARLEPHVLGPGRSYEVRFLSRMRSETGGKRAAVVRALIDLIGFELTYLVSLKRDMRMPGRPNASDELWYARLRWPDHRSATVLTIEDPFFFYDVREIGA